MKRLINILRQNGRISMACLATELGVDERKARQLVEDARRGGVPILSSTHPKEGGYWLPSDSMEIGTWLAGRSNKIKRERSLIKNVFQQRLFEVEDGQ